MSATRTIAFRLSSSWKVVFISLVAVLLIGSLIWWRVAAARGGQGKLITRTVTGGNIKVTVSASGTVVPVQEVTLNFKSPGIVQSCSVKMGDSVTSGQLLAQEQTDDLRLQLEQAQASLNAAQSNYSTQQTKLSQAQAQANQTKEIWHQLIAGHAPQSEINKANSDDQNAQSQYAQASAGLASQQAQVKSAQIQVAQAQNNLNGAELVAPFTGNIVQVNGSAGQLSSSGGNAALSSGAGNGTGGVTGNTAINSNGNASSQFGIVLASTDLKLMAEINEADIAKVQNGQKVTFAVDAFPNKTFTGKITAISPEASSVSNVQMYKAEISIDDAGQLKAGLPANISITTDQANNVLVVPQMALDYGRTHLAVLKQGGGRRTGSFRNNLGGNRSAADQSDFNGSGTASVSGNAAPAGRGYVVVLANGKQQLRQFETGRSDDQNIEIKSGLQKGEQVVITQTGTSANRSNSTNGGNGASTSGTSNGNRNSGFGGGLRLGGGKG